MTSKKIKDAAEKLKELEPIYYRKLLSGDAGRRQEARDDIADINVELKDRLVKLSAFLLLDDVKLWLANDPKTKDIKFLDDLKGRADNLVGADWEVQWIRARAYRVAGRFEKAFNNYNAAISALPTHPPPSAPDVERFDDLYADYAEFLVYLGDPAEAILTLNNKISKMKGWHYWVKAYAHHQNSFAQEYPLGTLPKSLPGPAKHYSDSNTAIDKAIDPKGYNPLSPSESCDAELLRVANYGALWRLGVANGGVPDGTQMTSALHAFQGPNSDNENGSWSLQKERRGRFVLIYRASLYDKKEFKYPKKKDVESWQLAYQQHFFDNLNKGNTIPVYDFSSDGEIDRDEDHSDDNGM